MSNAIEFKATDGQINIDEAKGIVECFVAGVGNKDSVGDIVMPGAFDASLKRRVPRVVWGHDWNHPIGKVLEIYEVPPSHPRLPMKMKNAGIGGLFAKVQFNLNSEKGREAFLNVSFFGMDQEWSIGYKTLDSIYDNARQANILKEVELYEVSPVLHGANQLTGTISIKSDTEVLEKKEPLKDPKGGLTAAGRRHYARTEGANLKPGVMGAADTPQKMRRKGSFLTRFFTNPSGPLVDDNGKPTRLALSAAAWGEPVPKNQDDAQELAAKGRRLLERYANTKKKGEYQDDNEESYGHKYREHERRERQGDDQWPDMDDTPSYGMKLSRALAEEMDAPVKVRTSDDNMIVFDQMSNGKIMTFRMSYHYEDGEFMFGRAERVRPEVIYLPYGDDGGSGHAFTGDSPYEKTALDEELDMWLSVASDSFGPSDEMTVATTETIGIDELGQIAEKAGRVLSRSNLEKLQQAIGLLRDIIATGGREDIEMKVPQKRMIPSDAKSLFSLKQHLEPVFEYYDVKSECNERGIEIIDVKGDARMFDNALANALLSYGQANGIEAK